MKHLNVTDLSTPAPPVDLATWMAAKTAEFEAEFAAARARWQQPRHLHVVDGGAA